MKHKRNPVPVLEKEFNVIGRSCGACLRTGALVSADCATKRTVLERCKSGASNFANDSELDGLTLFTKPGKQSEPS